MERMKRGERSGEREKERERRVREKDEESMSGKEKTDVPKLYAYNEYEHSVDTVVKFIYSLDL